MNDGIPIPTPAPGTVIPAQAPPEPQPVATPGQQAPPPAAPPAAKPKRPVLLYAIIGVVVLLIAIAVYVLAAAPKPSETPVAVPTPTVFVTPTPPQNLSRISSTSAFLEFTGEVASLSGVLNSFVLQDATLTPPVFETDIEFAQ